MARSYWKPARVVRNGGGGYWEVEVTEEFTDPESGEVHRVGDRGGREGTRPWAGWIWTTRSVGSSNEKCAIPLLKCWASRKSKQIRQAALDA
jgi:hypothetical protein